jgi:glutathione synthase/RimK-type ligase-like ATP-grasp enzyme
MNKFDITILTDSRFINPVEIDDNIRTVLIEDNFAKEALERKGLKVERINWDNKNFDWEETRFAIFKTTWDYFDRFEEFSKWLDETRIKTVFINPVETILWNIDKHYLLDLKGKGINIPETIFVEQGDKRTLDALFNECGWKDCILKPAVSGAARHTFKLNKDNISEHEEIYKELISIKSMLIQEFQYNVLTDGELTFVVFDGKFSHAVLKKAKSGDFRVQDDFGGTVHNYTASEEEIKFAEHVVSLCSPVPVYGRVDAILDNNNKLAVSELELIEPELWFRNCPESADRYAIAVLREIERQVK